VVNESFFPGWEARVDGGAHETILLANGIVRGIVVGAGSHRVEFAYRPRSFRWGAAISLTSALAVAAAAIWCARGERRETAEPITP